MYRHGDDWVRVVSRKEPAFTPAHFYQNGRGTLPDFMELTKSAYASPKACEAYRIVMSRKPIIVYDTETTGLKADDYVIQFSGDLYETVNGKYQRTDKLNIFIQSPKPVPKEASDVNHITDDVLKEKGIPMHEAAERIAAFLWRGSFLCAYNAKFDQKMITNMFLREHMSSSAAVFERQMLDPLIIARELINAPDLTDRSYKLCNVAEYYGVTTEGFHDSDVDIQNTWDVLVAEIRDLRDRIEKERKQKQSPEFTISAMKRWTKDFGYRHKVDKLYISSSLGQLVFDYNTGEVKPKDEDVVLPDEQIVMAAMAGAAKRLYGCSSIYALQTDDM